MRSWLTLVAVVWTSTLAVAVDPRVFPDGGRIRELGEATESYIARGGVWPPDDWYIFLDQTHLLGADMFSAEEFGISYSNRFTFITNDVTVLVPRNGSNVWARLLIVENGPVHNFHGGVYWAGVASLSKTNAFGVFLSVSNMTEALRAGGVVVDTPKNWAQLGRHRSWWDEWRREPARQRLHALYATIGLIVVTAIWLVWRRWTRFG